MPAVRLGDDSFTDLIGPMTVSDKDIWVTANSLIRHHGGQAETRTVTHHQAMMDRGGSEGMAAVELALRLMGNA